MISQQPLTLWARNFLKSVGWLTAWIRNKHDSASWELAFLDVVDEELLEVSGLVNSMNSLKHVIREYGLGNQMAMVSINPQRKSNLIDHLAISRHFKRSLLDVRSRQGVNNGTRSLRYGSFNRTSYCIRATTSWCHSKFQACHRNIMKYYEIPLCANAWTILLKEFRPQAANANVMKNGDG